MNLNMLGLMEQFFAGNSSNQQQMIQMAIAVIMSLIQSHPGGLQGLIQQFEQSGLGPQVQSWIGTGQNMPVTPAQMQQAINPAQMGQISQQSGMQNAQIASALSMLLPQLIDHLTPNGNVLHDAAVNQNLTTIKNLLSGLAAANPQSAA